MRLLRTIRLDPSDTFVFERAAEPGETAVSGAFMFWDTDPKGLQGKTRAAFRSGFLGVRSFGWSTLVQIVEAKEGDREAAIETLARQLMENLGAPSMAEGRRAAEEELAFASSLCTHPPDTLIAVHRTHDDGQIRESFRSLRPRPGSDRMPVYAFLEAADEEPEEPLDLAALGKEARK